MADLGLRTSPVGQFVQLNSALERATGVLSKAESTSAAKACLAEAILSLAAEGETNPVKLSETALTRVRGSCAACGGCDGLRRPPDRHQSLFPRQLSSKPMRVMQKIKLDHLDR